MHLSWRLQILMPWLAVVGLTAFALATQQGDFDRLQAGFTAALRRQERLERGLRQIADRHAQAMQWAQQLGLSAPLGERAPPLEALHQRYLADVERGVAGLRRGLVPLAGAELGLETHTDVERLHVQLARLLEAARPIPARLAHLHDALVAGEAEAVRACCHQLARASSAVHASLRVADGTVRSLAEHQLQPLRLAAPLLRRQGPLLLLLPALCMLSALACLRPLRRVQGHLAGRALAGGNAEERQLAARLQHLVHREAHSASQLAERARACQVAEQRARRLEHELALVRCTNENLANSLRSAVVSTDLHGTITGANRMARRLLGSTAAAAGRPMAQMPLHAALRKRCPNLDAAVVAISRGSEGHLFAALELDRGPSEAAESAGPAVVDLTLAPDLDEGGTARGLLWVVDDVTDAVATKHQLLAAERLAAVGRLCAQVAHEVRNPLSAIGLNAEMLQEDLVAHLDPVRGAEAAHMLGAIAKEVERLTAVTEAYLQLARQPKPQPRPADVNQILADMFVMLGEEMRQQHIEVALDLGSPAPTAQADPGQLRQALLNLLRNGREAMPAGGALRVATWAERGQCHISIADTGAGIAAEALPHVLEPFYSTKPAGTGLGLSLTNQIVHEHGGELKLTSSPAGTQVWVRLPAPAATP